ncbi:MAG TPA: RNase H1/viroplasmin domain-containing protein, partial [Cyclobacteriaceae bacterium]|nr:RNase H1/viroplasmin domain-containing protein [Cyclobacteriaceae bacterium]
MKNSAYTVWVGRHPGIYRTWPEAEAQVKGFKGSKFKGFLTHKQAEEAFAKPWEDYYKKPTSKDEVVNTVELSTEYL